MKKIASMVMSVLMVLTLLVVPNNIVYANNVSISVSASSVDIGDSVTVTVTVPTGITAQIDVAYSSDLLSFSNCSTTANNNGSSVTMNLGSFSTPTATLTFSAKASGTATFTVTPITAGSEETAEEVALGGASASVTIANKVTETPPVTPEVPVLSDDNKLGYLKISSGTLSPGFSPNTTKYTATVSYDVTKVTVSAVPSSASAVVTAVSGGSDLQVGENTIKITVKAENGVSQTYTIVITRKEKVETPDSETDNSETESEVPVKKLSWNGSELDFVDNIPKDVIPTGFKTSSKMVNNEEVPVLDFKDGMLTVMYLSDKNGDNTLYVYDEKTQDVYPFVSLGDEEKYVVVLRPDDATAPKGYLSCTLSIEGKGVVSAYQFNTEELLEEEDMTSSWFGAETFFAAEPIPSDFYLIYCLNNDGEYGWYQYDSVEETFQRYSAALFHAAATVEPDMDEDTEEDSTELETLKRQMMIIIIAAAVVVVILLIIIIVLAVKLNRSNEGDYYDDEYDDKDDDVYFYDEDDADIEMIEDAEPEEDDEVEIEFYEMPAEPVAEVEEAEDDEIEIEFYEMPEAEKEVVVPDMEDLLVKEALKEKEETPKTVEIPKTVETSKVEPQKRVVTPIMVDDDDDDSDLEFIELD